MHAFLSGSASVRRGAGWLACAVVAVFLGACASSEEKAREVHKDVMSAADQAKAGPKAIPSRSFTSFTPALRCMDNLMLTYGVKGVNALVEDLQDATKKVNAGTRDMLITAMSEMTRRSRAVRVVAFGKDSGNLISFLDAAQRQSAYQTIPQFDIKGSVTQWDENVVRTQKDAGLGFQPFINFGVSGDAAASTRSFFAFKLHQFISGAGLAFSTLERAGERTVTVEGQKFLPAQPEKRLYPVHFCRDCGHEYHPGRLVTEDGARRFLARDIDDAAPSTDDAEGAPAADGDQHRRPGYLPLWRSPGRDRRRMSVRCVRPVP